ncbi:SurA N-terminal domain-containing protein [Pelagibacteraceae bacterium]|nr:SurA N-terminal domain-containing protein [Pelagibacteraceae bacterium]
MFTSIKKITTSFLAKVLIGIIILPFLFWGMGDVFRGGNQNVLATIDSEKISAQSFVEYVNRLNLNDQQRKNLGKSNLLDKILSDYVGKKIISLEIEDNGIFISDQSLKNIITTDKTFSENNKFSRTKYEKFLLESSISAPIFEQNIAEQERKRQLLTFLSEGIFLSDALIRKEFENENQIKTIQYLDLDKLYQNLQIKDENIKKTYESNKNLFVQNFKKINYTELLPDSLSGQKEYNEAYFKKIDDIENAILDGGKMEDFVKMFDLKLTSINSTNQLKKNKTGQDIVKIEDNLFTKIFNSQNIKRPELINVNNKYYLSEIVKVEQVSRSLDDKKIKDAIISQLKVKKIIETNSNIVKKMSEGKFNKIEFFKFGKDNKIEVKKIILKDIKNETIFSGSIIKEIFKIKDGELQLVTNSTLTKNYIIFSEKTEKLPFNKDIKNYDQYKAKAKLNLANQIYTTYDQAINDKYNVEINQKVLSRIKNTL